MVQLPEIEAHRGMTFSVDGVVVLAIDAAGALTPGQGYSLDAAVAEVFRVLATRWPHIFGE